MPYFSISVKFFPERQGQNEGIVMLRVLKNHGFDRNFAKAGMKPPDRRFAYWIKNTQNSDKIIAIQPFLKYEMKYELSFCIDKFVFLCENRYEKGLISTKRKR